MESYKVAVSMILNNNGIMGGLSAVSSKLTGM
jgi:hypothetical protein